MSINLLLNDYCDLLMTSVYAFLHTMPEIVHINREIFK